MNKWRQLKRFKSDENGNIGAMAGVTFTFVMAIIGTSMDYQIASNAKSRSQEIADAVALRAAIFVRTHDRIPNSQDENAIQEGTHLASALGFTYGGGVIDRADGVNVVVDYDDTNRNVTVTVSGKTQTGFTSILGKETLDFGAKSLVTFQKEDVSQKASVMLVLDNSGSMAWDDSQAYRQDGVWHTPDDARARVTVLKENVNSFMTFLDELVDDQNTDRSKVLRTGMLAYNSSTIHALTRSMQWSTISTGHVNSMSANGGTNSSIPMASVVTTMAAEDAAHAVYHQETPLKFVVLMTDGVNNNLGSEWRAKSGTGYWRTTYDAKYSFRTTWYQQSGYRYAEGASSPPANWESSTYRTNDGFRYHIDYRADGWVEGEWSKPDDESTIADCDTLKANGTTIYTIGFALEPGNYGKNSYDYYGREDLEYITEEETTGAYAMLSACASDGKFIIAANAAELNKAFEDIGEDILEEFIRIRS